MSTASQSDSTTTCSCAIVVTYHPEMAALLKLLSQLNRETDFLVIDNGSPDADRLRDSIVAYPRCLEYRRLEDNVGLAQALNYGLEEAQKRNYQFALLFDQDSSLGDLYVESMLAAYQEALDAGGGGEGDESGESGESGKRVESGERGKSGKRGRRKVAAIGPRVINPQTQRQTPFKLFNRIMFRSDQPFHDSRHLFQADILITSGTLLPLSCLDDIGPMKTSYFIDNVDLEWCFRAKSLGYALAGTDRAILYHAIGERSDDPLVRKGLLAKHNPDRTYYSSRNRVHLYGVSYSPWGWILRDFVRFFIKTSWLVLTSSQRRQYWQNITAGIRDARSLS